MAITPIFMYWITRLNHINAFLIITAILSLLMFLVAIIGSVVTYVDEDCNSKETFPKFKKIAIISGTIGLVTTLITVFTPTTKEMCAIYIVPQIVNSEKIQNISNEFYDLALQWMKELRPNKKEIENVQSVRKEKH